MDKNKNNNNTQPSPVGRTALESLLNRMHNNSKTKLQSEEARRDKLQDAALTGAQTRFNMSAQIKDQSDARLGELDKSYQLSIEKFNFMYEEFMKKYGDNSK